MAFDITNHWKDRECSASCSFNQLTFGAQINLWELILIYDIKRYEQLVWKMGKICKQKGTVLDNVWGILEWPEKRAKNSKNTYCL